MEKLNVIDLGLCEYAPALELQRELVARTQAGDDLRDHFVLVEHDPPTVTLGRRSEETDLLLTRQELARRGTELHAVTRGGQTTWHGPGQLTGYVITRLKKKGRTLRWLVEGIQRALSGLCGELGVRAAPLPGCTGLWVDTDPPAKIASIGVAVEKYVSYHGFALNVCNDLEPFGWIVPCGARGAAVTSLARQLRRPITVGQVKPLAVGRVAELLAAE
ncbi:MAG: lipoyl(octanoyl) transferase LipB [Phycisphaerae bacterium]